MCGITGALIRNAKDNRYFDLLKASDIRGQDGTGICILRDGLFLTVRWECRAQDIKDFPELYDGDLVIGQNRLAIFGLSHDNDQPLVSDKTAIVHNGNLQDFDKAFEAHPELLRTCKVDTELILRMFNQRAVPYSRSLPESIYAGDSMAEALADVFTDPLVKGNAACILLHEDHTFMTAASYDKPLLAMSLNQNVYLFSTARIGIRVFGEAAIHKYALALHLQEIKTIYL